MTQQSEQRCKCGEPHDNWPGKDSGQLCQMCWEAECSESWWACVIALDTARAAVQEPEPPMTTDERSAEERVRACWEVECAIEDHRLCCATSEWRAVITDVWSAWAASPTAAWDAALVFTLEHQRKVAELGIEVALMNGLIAVTQSQNDKEVYKRILARLQAALSELRRGTRGAE